MFAHDVPVELQRIHWYLNAMGAVPVQLPVCPVRIFPTTGEPVTDGPLVFWGDAESESAIW
jgi:hypothetical protein